MAEAAVQDAAIARFFCHKCSVEIPRVLPDYTCPNCYSGFIEELEAPPDLTDDSDTEMEDVAPIELLNQRLGDELNEILLGVSGGNDERRVLRGRDRDGSDSRRPGRYGSIIPRQRIMRNSCVSRVPRGRQMAPIENLIQDFLVNLTGVGWGALGGARAGNAPVFFLGNPGDYAWGREGLDAIVTQLLNQMDGTGPPPLAKDKIKEIPVVVITQDQVGKSLQCSVCWEDFRLDEPVRKLPCEHVYHENCIIPWLELHGTCPICRKSLGDEGLEDHQPGSGGSNMSNVGPSLAAFFRAANDSANSRASSTSSSTSSSSSSTTGGNTSSSSSRSSRPSDFNMDLEFD
ncbi:E3 ubiquitin-protein ligase RNF126 isoform X1 [Zootermopsis nevadensis]|uniref:E3 ubiquitin-protein ligase RNF126 isoform X1 n=1 Tax=Zootermopsis nevadensis TaxID=136037 RepID=UPI000B8E3216|nr:E3 ubiquitin-protein ligase RNF126 isoform X1 [Zootermopsis nevadensis]XP_021935030.1 E3 ubiquitin-protein ligase RNF126 isoform X1 [Zootermopsis nevadensis]XP_021935039.1 E3 ubiquitin-protein ligase RNF126 isoform X1 [Zootermopsis nevadensis]